MAESYFELLTEQRGLPAKPFDPLEELRYLRRRLAVRIQNHEFIGESGSVPVQEKLWGTEVAPSEPILLETVVKQVGAMKKTLLFWQRSRHRSKPQSREIYRRHPRMQNRRRASTLTAQFLGPAKEGMLEKLHSGLMALGVVGVVFGLLSFYRGWESDLSLGSLVCASGATVIAIGTTGLLLASWCGPAVGKQTT